MSIIRRIIAGALCIFVFNISSAQDEDFYDLKSMVSGDQEELESLALYPDDIRDAILEVCLYPELLVKLGAIQSKTQALFQEVIGYQPEDIQKNYWELLRYPGLVDKLVTGGQKSGKEIEKILKEYPEDVHPIAIEYGTSRLRTLEKINTINRDAETALEFLLKDYKKETQEKVRTLFKFPEVLHIMVEHIDVAILVGEYYKKDPAMVLAKAESLKLEVARRYESDVAAWKEGLQEDPQALKEFEEVSQEFKNEGQYDNDPMYQNSSTPKVKENEAKDENGQTDVQVYYNYYPYPFWYGYPTWFPHVYWYRYPYWYHQGYYYGTESSIVIFGLPSYYYFYWYFGYPTHYYRYPYLSDYIIRYYRTRRGVGPSRGNLNSSIDDWKRSSRSTIPSSILEENNDRLRREKIREYGRFEENYRKKVEKRPNEIGSREEYLQNNRTRYPHLSGQTRTVKERSSQPIPKTRSNISTTKPTRSMELNRAREQHQRTWERSNYNRSKTPVQPSRSKETKKKRGN
jgi:hypothetical protein